MRKIRIDFCDFWEDFCKTDNFFWNLLKTRFDVELHGKPDFLFYSNREQHVHRVHNCVKIFFAVESYLPNWRECDYAMTYHYLEDPRHLRLPFYLLYGTADHLLNNGEDIERLFASKTKFCSFIVSNPGKREGRKRVEFFHSLSRYKRVDSGGKVLNNIGGPIAGGPEGKLAFLRPYKFNIAFENAAISGYTTEKIVEAMRARTVPIFWGNPRINEEFNSSSFLNYSDFPSADALIERIIELDRNDEKYMEILRQPYFPGNQATNWYDPERFLSFCERIFSEPITPVSRRRKFFQIGRWVLVKQNRPHSN